MTIILGPDQVRLLAAPRPVTAHGFAGAVDLTAARREAALCAVALAEREHGLQLRRLTIDPAPGGGLHVAGEVPGLRELARWAAIYRQDITATPREGRYNDPYAARDCRCSVALGGGFAEFSTRLDLWTVVKPPTGDVDVDRLLGLSLADRLAVGA